MMTAAIAVGIVVLCVCALVLRHFTLDFQTHTLHEEMVIAVVVDQIAKEQRHADGQLASYDKDQRRIACMQRFQRLAVEKKLVLPPDLAARINAQLTIKRL